MYRSLLLLAICLSLFNPSVTQNWGFNGARQNQGCMTPNRRPGTCVVLQQCEPLLAILREQPVTPQAVQFLRQSQCGFQGRSPIVCCNSANAPHNSQNPWAVAPPPTTTTTTRRPPWPGSAPARPPPGPPGTSGATSTSVANHRNRNLLPVGECGEDFAQRIFGGNITAINEFPWTALLQYQNRAGVKRFLCGGVLISKRYVLTAAHCTSKADLRGNTLVGVRLGEYNTDTAEDCDTDFTTGEQVCADPPRDYGIEQEIAHAEYRGSSRNQHHDIALLRLNGDAPSDTDYIRPICIPLEDEVRSKQFLGSDLTVAGWGRTETKSASPFKLKVKVPVVSNDQCQTIYSRKNRTISPNQLCAGGQKGKDSCSGDSGGPLMSANQVARDATFRFYSTGVVSYGPDPCGEEGWPGVYTRVSAYVGWILDNMRP